jgi:hypothetical protein
MSWPRGPPRNKTVSELAEHPGNVAAEAPAAAAPAAAGGGGGGGAAAAAAAQAAHAAAYSVEGLLGGGGGGGAANNNASSYVSGLSGYNSNRSFWGRGHSRNMYNRQKGKWTQKQEEQFLQQQEQLRQLRRARLVQECATAAALFEVGDRVQFAPVGIWAIHDTTETVAIFEGMATECIANVRVVESLMHQPGALLGRDVRELRHPQKPLRVAVGQRANLSARRQATRNVYEEATGGQFAGKTGPYKQISDFLESPRTKSTAPENTLPALKWKKEPKEPKNPNGSEGGGGGGGGSEGGASSRKTRKTRKRKTIINNY